MLVSPAWAQGAGGGFGGMESLLPLVLIFVVFYFLLIRPQQKKAKTHRAMLGNLHRGDRVVTNGGLIGVITRVPNDNELIVEIADGVKVRVMRSMISEGVSKSDPASRSSKDKPRKEKTKTKVDEEYGSDEAVEDVTEEEKDKN
ncbi:MAG: preprotein translocase subunit YajC [Pseudomonadota bacterium]|nr:preprotein translocase subunit YajC [Pseudomonadota bacterium]